MPAFRAFGFGFLISTDWDPVRNQYGALVPIFGTVVTAMLAMVMAVPLAFGIAVFLTEIAPAWLRGPVGTAIELLAAVKAVFDPGNVFNPGVLVDPAPIDADLRVPQARPLRTGLGFG